MSFDEAVAIVEAQGTHGGMDELLQVMAQSLVEQSMAEHEAAKAALESEEAAATATGSEPGASPDKSAATDAPAPDAELGDATEGGDSEAPVRTSELAAKALELGRLDAHYDVWTTSLDE